MSKPGKTNTATACACRYPLPETRHYYRGGGLMTTERTSPTPPTTPPTVAHDSADYETEAERLYRERVGSAVDEYELADIEATLIYEVDDDD